MRSCSLVFLVAMLGLLPMALPGQSPRREKVGSLSFVVPKGWSIAPDKNSPAGRVLKNPEEYPMGQVTMHDVFLVDVHPAQKHTLEAFKDYLLHVFNGNIEKSAKEWQQKYPAQDKRLKVEVTRDFHLDTRKTTLDKVPAYEFDVHNLILVQGTPIRMHNRTFLALFEDNYYTVATGYKIEREKNVKPVYEAFLAALRFERAK